VTDTVRTVADPEPTVWPDVPLDPLLEPELPELELPELEPPEPLLPELELELPAELQRQHALRLHGPGRGHGLGDVPPLRGRGQVPGRVGGAVLPRPPEPGAAKRDHHHHGDHPSTHGAVGMARC
jgi:hypothetical protein